jgi:sarcosine oxidase subunit alpha
MKLMNLMKATRGQEFRNGWGGSIDRGKPLTFFFNGKRYQGFEGDTLASALIANGVHLVGRSFKYHRPRGIMTAGPEEPNALVQVGMLADRGVRRRPGDRPALALVPGRFLLQDLHVAGLIVDDL